MNKIGIFVHPRWAAARHLADEVHAYLSGKVDEVWQTSAWEDHDIAEHLPGTDLFVCLGGDGSMLWAARVVIPHAIPVLGVNMGRLGFLAELSPDDLLLRLPDVLAGRGRIEERTMLQAQVPAWGLTFHALNDVVVGRLQAGRPVYIDVAIDGSRLALYRCDAVIVSTATGSTAYSLSAGGPILTPESRELVLTPVAPHLAAARPLVLPTNVVVDMVVSTDMDAVVSIDGQVDRTLSSGESVSVCRSPYVARFVRFSRPQDYYATLAERLDLLRVVKASNHPELFDLDRDAPPK
ncbi:MAG TPA: NAD(+)/NADH kinase [Dehalococcoidia bacterium]|nr:NAD(+)/NADH kinase [Dehalococcoidia bacterium]